VKVRRKKKTVRTANRPGRGLFAAAVAWLRARFAPPPKLRVVLDTNVLVSGLLPNNEPPACILRQVYDGKLIWLISPGARREVELVLTNNDLRGVGAIPAAAKARLRTALRNLAATMPNSPLPRPVAEHEADDKFIAAAVAGKADFLISDDRHLLHVKRHRGVKIVSAAQFWRRFGD